MTDKDTLNDFNKDARPPAKNAQRDLFAYYRVVPDGETDRAIDRMVEAQDRVRQLRVLLGKLMPFISLPVFFTDGERCTLQTSPEKVPAGWRVGSRSQKICTVHPPPGSEAERQIRAVCSLAHDITTRECTLEQIFAIAPSQENPPKNVSMAFVVGGQAHGVPQDGRVQGTFFHLPEVNAPMLVTFSVMEGQRYLRVPVRADGKPLFKPPGCEPYSYEKMMRLDQRISKTRDRNNERTGRPTPSWE